ncbi:MAG: hypothetical protein JNL83_28185 [Myxococcales bacterium]|nr:hypothetical protein [Myxococcales bacterium]
MPEVAFEDAAPALVVFHALAAIVLIGASTHHAIIAVGYLRGSFKTRLGRIYAAVGAIAYGVTFVLGLFAYPAFRYHTRGLYLDRYEPWASNLFDIKENFAALGLPLVIGALVLSRVMKPSEDATLLRGYAAMVLLTAAIVWFSVISGLVIGQARGV